MLLSKKQTSTILLIILILCALFVRISLLNTVTDDMRYFLIPWYDYLSSHGMHGIATIASNYNVPYLYLLWIATHAPFSAIVSIKMITILFEFIFAILIYAIAKDFYPKKGGFVPLFAAVTALFIPTLLIQGALWGQCDVIYTTFLIASWWMLTKKRAGYAWLMFGFALSFKLQAIFFLPYLGYMWFTRTQIRRPLVHFHNRSVLYPLIPLCALVVLSIPALLVGKSPSDLVNVYIGQMHDPGTAKTLGDSVVSVYQLMVDTTNQSNLYLATPGIICTIALCVLIIGIYLIYGRKTYQKDFFILPLLIMILIPFFLPFMHERYFFAAELFAFLFALLYRKKWLLMSAMLLQFTALGMYANYLWGSHPWPPQFLSAVQVSIIAYLCYKLFSNDSSPLLPKASRDIQH